MTHFSMGALNKETRLYESPSIAQKIIDYICPDCGKDVMFKRGEIRIPHFSHYREENPCNYYSRPNETQIHKDAKMLLKLILDNKRKVYFKRRCDRCNTPELVNIDTITENTNIKIEHRFSYNESDKSADVAYLENNEIKYIFEMCYSNKTLEKNRPEPWFEIDAEKLIEQINSETATSDIIIKCIRRSRICEPCVIQLREEEERNKRVREKMKEEYRIRLIVEEQKQIAKQEIIDRENKIKEEQRIANQVIIDRENKIKEEHLLKEKSKYIEGWNEHFNRTAQDGMIVSAKVQIQKYMINNDNECKELLTKIRFETKKCSKCTFKRCKKCNDKIMEKHKIEINKLADIEY